MINGCMLFYLLNHSCLSNIRAEFTKRVVEPAFGVSGVGGVMAIFGAADAIVSALRRILNDVISWGTLLAFPNDLSFYASYFSLEYISCFFMCIPLGNCFLHHFHYNLYFFLWHGYMHFSHTLTVMSFCHAGAFYSGHAHLFL